MDQNKYPYMDGLSTLIKLYEGGDMAITYTINHTSLRTRASNRKTLGLASYDSREYEAARRCWQLYGLPELVFNSLIDGQAFRLCYLLCVRCNVILGRVKDDPSILETAAAYLRFHNREGKLLISPAVS